MTPSMQLRLAAYRAHLLRRIKAAKEMAVWVTSVELAAATHVGDTIVRRDIQQFKGATGGRRGRGYDARLLLVAIEAILDKRAVRRELKHMADIIELVRSVR